MAPFMLAGNIHSSIWPEKPTPKSYSPLFLSFKKRCGEIYLLALPGDGHWYSLLGWGGVGGDLSQGAVGRGATEEAQQKAGIP